MIIKHTKWSRNYKTPNIGLIINDDYLQISFVFFNHHWWVIINRK